MFTFFMADVVSSQRFFRDVLLPSAATGGVTTEISEPAAEPVELMLFVRDSEPPADTVLLDRE